MERSMLDPAGRPAVLGKGAIRHFDAAIGMRVACSTGAVWITVDGDPRDVVLGPGDELTLDRSGAALVNALADSTIRWRAADQPKPHRRRTAFESARNWLGALRPRSTTAPCPSAQAAAAR